MFNIECYSREVSFYPFRRMPFMNHQLVRYIPFPYFSLTNLMEFLLLKTNNLKVMYTSQTFWICNLEPWKKKRKYKAIESDSPNKSPKRSAKRQKMREIKDSGRTVALMTKRNIKKLKIFKVDIIVNCKKWVGRRG